MSCRTVSCRVKTSLKLTCAIQSGWSAFFLSSHKCYLLRFFIRSSLLIFDFKEEEIDALAPLHVIGFLVLVYFVRFLIYVIFRSVYAVIYLYTYIFFSLSFAVYGFLFGWSKCKPFHYTCSLRHRAAIKNVGIARSSCPVEYVIHPSNVDRKREKEGGRKTRKREKILQNRQRYHIG